MFREIVLICEENGFTVTSGMNSYAYDGIIICTKPNFTYTDLQFLLFQLNQMGYNFYVVDRTINDEYVLKIQSA